MPSGRRRTSGRAPRTSCAPAQRWLVASRLQLCCCAALVLGLCWCCLAIFATPVSLPFQHHADMLWPRYAQYGNYAAAACHRTSKYCHNRGEGRSLALPRPPGLPSYDAVLVRHQPRFINKQFTFIMIVASHNSWLASMDISTKCLHFRKAFVIDPR